jgi:hypothetical protein
MIPNAYFKVIQEIMNRLKGNAITWVVTGSLGMALQGVPVEIHDIDIQTDQNGAYEIEKRFAEYGIQSVHYLESERMRSHFGKLEIDGITVDIMGDIQKRLDDQSWETSVEIERYRRWVEVGEMRIPVLSLEYEYQAYLTLGRSDKAEMLRSWLQKEEAG